MFMIGGLRANEGARSRWISVRRGRSALTNSAYSASIMKGRNCCIFLDLTRHAYVLIMTIAATLFWMVLLVCITAGFASRSALASEAMTIYVVTYKSTALPEDILSIERLIMESGGMVYYYNDEIYGFIVGMPDTATGLGG